MIQLNPPHRGRKYLLGLREGDGSRIPQMEEIFGGGKNGGRKEVGSAIRRRKGHRGSTDIKK